MWFCASSSTTLTLSAFFILERGFSNLGCVRFAENRGCLPSIRCLGGSISKLLTLVWLVITVGGAGAVPKARCVSRSSVPKPPGLIIGWSASACSFAESVLAHSLTSFLTIAIFLWFVAVRHGLVIVVQNTHLVKHGSLLLNTIRHIEIIQAMLPWEVHDNIRS